MAANNTYETMLIFSVTGGEEGVQALTEKFKALVEEHGTLESVEEWGNRKLAYPINDEPEGYYVLFNITCGPEFPAEFERVAKITEGVLRSLVVRK